MKVTVNAAMRILNQHTQFGSLLGDYGAKHEFVN